jgi:molecular chaperone DnaK
VKYHKVIGIDLGTTHSVVSVWDYDRKEVVVIPTAVGENTLPSVVGIDDEQKVIVGAPAQRRRVLDPQNTIIEIKREMGEYSKLPQANDPGVPKRVHFRGRDYLPQEISAFILTELKRQAESFLGEEIHDAVITVPAYFKEPQREATADAAAIAQLNVKQLLNEPTAAAVSFGADLLDDQQTHLYLVYDLGGGTFDVSIIEVGNKNVSIVGTGGNSRLGGCDFDDCITKWALDEIRKCHDVDLSNNEQAKARIKEVAQRCKRELSAATTTVLDLMYLTPTVSVNLTLTRAVFNSLIEDLLKQSLDCLTEAIDSAARTRAIRKEDIEQVLLVGGSTRIPRVRSMLVEYMGHMQEKDIRSDINPDEALACGAALVARGHNPSVSFEGKEIDLLATGAISLADKEEATSLVLQDVTSHTLGILVSEQDFNPIIEKESRIPAQVTREFHLNAGCSGSIDIQIYQGEGTSSSSNTVIGSLPILLPESREGRCRDFDVTFTLNSDGLLHVAVKSLSDEQTYTTNIDCPLRSSRERIVEGAKLLQRLMVSDATQSYTIPAPPHPFLATPVALTGKRSSEAPAARIDKVHFSVSSPPAVRPGENFLVDVWAHVEQQRAEVERQVQLANPEPEIPRVIRPKGPFKIERGTRLFVRLRFQDFQVEPPQEVILWDGEIGNASFTVGVPHDTTLGPKIGLVTVHWEGGLQIARVPIQILVAARVDATNPTALPVHHIRSAFASYASADRDEVLGRIQGMQKVAPDLKVFLDVAELRSGEDWETKLWQVIPESDVLYLFWSAAAKASPWVEKEWRCGLSTRGYEFVDPVPLVSPEEVRPPEELSGKHFNDWVLAYRRGRPNTE